MCIRDSGYDMYIRLLGEAVSLMKGEEPENPIDEECLIDMQVQAHIPESYIDSTSLRLEVYRRIAEVRKEEDAFDVTDELIDRFGDPPEAVKGLIDVSLLRNTAAKIGIKEISQRADSLLLYPETVDMEKASHLASALKGRVMLNAGAKPYITVKVAKGEKPIDTMRIALGIMSGENVDLSKK